MNQHVTVLDAFNASLFRTLELVSNAQWTLDVRSNGIPASHFFIGCISRYGRPDLRPIDISGYNSSIISTMSPKQILGKSATALQNAYIEASDITYVQQEPANLLAITESLPHTKDANNKTVPNSPEEALSIGDTNQVIATDVVGAKEIVIPSTMVLSEDYYFIANADKGWGEAFKECLKFVQETFNNVIPLTATKDITTIIKYDPKQHGDNNKIEPAKFIEIFKSLN